MNTGKINPSVRVVLDTNVYISAILFGGNAEAITLAGKEGEIEILVSPHILTEIADILKKKFQWSQWQITEVIEDIRETAAVIIPPKTVRIIKADRADNRILECAFEGKADYIVSGDKKHIQPIKKFRGIPVLSPAQFAISFLK